MPAFPTVTVYKISSVFLALIEHSLLISVMAYIGLNENQHFQANRGKSYFL